MSHDMVTIPAERLRELEEAAAFAARVREKQRIKLEKLNEYNRLHPEKIAERGKRFIDKDRDAHNAKRREKRRLLKEAKAAATSEKTEKD